MHLQIVDFDCRNYNIKCKYYKGIVKYSCNLIQVHDDDKPLTPNVGIAIIEIVLVTVLYFHFGPFNARCT
jgi:hypothetical protein